MENRAFDHMLGFMMRGGPFGEGMRPPLPVDIACTELLFLHHNFARVHRAKVPT
jgi:hypothetical protein